MIKRLDIIFLIIMLMILFFLSGCGPGYYLRRSEKLRLKAIALGAIVKTDTVFTKKSVEIKGDTGTVDVPFEIIEEPGTKLTVQVKDTVIYKDRIKTVWKDRQVFIQCPDTVFRFIEKKSVITHVECPPESHTWRTVALVLIGVVLIMLVLMRVR